MTDQLTPNLENIQLWVDGLLSDEFEQGTGRLASCSLTRDPVSGEIAERGPKQLCCLGVAAEIAIRHGVAIVVTETELDDEIVFEYDRQRDFMPKAVRNWLGLEDSNPTLAAVLEDGTEAVNSASALNDGEAETPASIAWRSNGSVDEDPPHIRYLPKFTFREIAAALKHTYLRQEDDAQDQ